MRLQWHPDLHRELGKERLSFWRMGFAPTYDRSAVKECLLELFRTQDVHSYAFYEMIGIHDLMLRLWLPTSLTLRSFEADLKAALAQEGILLVEYFAVDDTLTHWVWTDEAGETRPVDDSVLTHGALDEGDIARINGGKIKPAQRKRFEEKNAIAPSSHVTGIKFFVLVTAGMLPMSVAYSRQTLSDEIGERLQGADNILEKSLYMGSGELGQFLIMGKVRPRNFDKIFSEVSEPINSLGLNRNFKARTYTHICTSGLVDFVDMLPPWEDVVRDSKVRPIKEYLRDEESRNLEVKGSAFVNVETWLKTKKPAFDEEILTKGVLRSIVGMLNAEGGVIVVGALEMREPFISATKEGGPLAKRPNFEDRYIIFGLNADFRVSGATQNWDAFLQRLNRRIRERISPQPTPWVTIDGSTVIGEPMAVISVREPDSGWFYLRSGPDDPGTFHVRQENETAVLAGALADEYKRAKHRI